MLLRAGGGAGEQGVVAAVGAPSDIEEVADEGDGAAGGFDGDVEHHAGDDDVGYAAGPCGDDEDGGGEAAEQVADAGDEADDAVEAEADGGAGDADEVVEEVREEVEVAVGEIEAGEPAGGFGARAEDFGLGGDGHRN